MRFITSIAVCLLLLNSCFGQGNFQAMERLHIHRNQSLDPLMNGASYAAYPLVVGAPLSLWLKGHFQHDADLKEKAWSMTYGLALTSFTTLAMKYSIQRDRPYVTYPLIGNLNYSPTPSFPSAHSSLSFSLATSLSLEFPKWYVVAPAYAWAGLTSYSRIHLGVHYPGDVLAGAATGVLCAYLNWKLKDWVLGKS